jgi:hypothetical protein
MSTQESSLPIEVATPLDADVANAAHSTWRRMTAALETTGE